MLKKYFRLAAIWLLSLGVALRLAILLPAFISWAVMLLIWLGAFYLLFRIMLNAQDLDAALLKLLKDLRNVLR